MNPLWAKHTQDIEARLQDLRRQREELARDLSLVSGDWDTGTELQDSLTITVVGEFNSGKSTLINALLGHEILPTGIVPTTATVNVVEYSETPEIVVFYNDGRTEALDYGKEALERFKATRGTFDNVRYISIRNPQALPRCRIIDTPGVNDMCQTRMDIVYGFIPKSDAVVFVMDVQQAPKKSEIDFLRERLLGSSLSRIVFVMNHVDRVTRDEVTELVQEAESKLRSIYASTALDFQARGCEVLCRQLQVATASIRVFPISAKSVIKGRGPNADLGFMAFSRALSEMTGASMAHRVRLQRQVSLMARAAMEMQLHLSTVESARAQSEAAFNARVDEFVTQLEHLIEQVDKVRGRMNTKLQLLKIESRNRLSFSLHIIKEQVVNDLIRMQSTGVSCKAEALLRRAVEVEMVALRTALSDIAGEFADSLRFPCSFGSGIALSETSGRPLVTSDPMAPIVFTIIEAIAYILFGPLGLLAGPLLAFLGIQSQRANVRSIVETGFDEATVKLLTEIERAIDQAGVQIQSLAVSSINEILIPLRAVLQGRKGGGASLDLVAARARLSRFTQEIDSLASRVLTPV